MSDWYNPKFRMPFSHPQFEACDCLITSKQFCMSFPDKPFSLCLKNTPKEKKDEEKSS